MHRKKMGLPCLLIPCLLAAVFSRPICGLELLPKNVHFQDSVVVTVISDIPGVKIFYKLDQDTSLGQWQPYVGPIVLKASTFVSAIENPPNGVIHSTHYIKSATGSFNPKPKLYFENQQENNEQVYFANGKLATRISSRQIKVSY